MKENPPSPENEVLFDRRTFLKGLFSGIALMSLGGNLEAAEDPFKKEIENTLKADEPLMGPMLKEKYGLSEEAWKIILEKTKKELLMSDDAKAEYEGGGMAALQRYVWFRTQLNAIGATEFSAAETGQNPDYQKLIETLSKKGIDPVYVQNLLKDERLKKTNLKPLYFYCRPHSAKKQHHENTLDPEKLFWVDIQLFKAWHEKWLTKAEAEYGVNREIIIAILKMESNLGLRTLDHSAFEVLNAILSRYFVDPIAPEKVREGLEKRAQKIKTVAAQNLAALIEHASKSQRDPFSIKSNLVGALGYPQFMPSNLKHYGVDADTDGKLNLEEMPDSILSIAKYLKHSGKWGKIYNLNQLRPEEAETIKKALLSYNKSGSYGKTILELAQKIQAESQN